MLITELVLLISMAIQFFLLSVLSPMKSKGILDYFCAATYVLASAIIIFQSGSGGNFDFMGYLLDFDLFRLPRAAMFIGGILMGRMVSVTRELPEERKPEAHFLLTAILFLCDMLILSQHLALTILLLLGISWIGLFLGGLSYRGRTEGEAIQKFWLQTSLAMVIGLGTLLGIVLVAGGLDNSTITEVTKKAEEFSGQSLFLVLSVFLPYILTMGFFPFHFVIIDRDEGIPWSVQAIFSVIVQGALALSMWKVGMLVFGIPRAPLPSDGMRSLQLFGIAGGYIFLIFALSQTSSKRLLSSILGANIAVILAAGAMPSSLGASAITYALAITFLWGSLLSFIWSRFQESVSDAKLESIFGLGKKYRFSGIIFLTALAAPLCIPGFPGFPAMFRLLAAAIEQQAMPLLFLEVILFVLICFVAAKLAADLLFRDFRGQVVSDSALARYGILDMIALFIVLLCLIGIGFFWSKIFIYLVDAAKIFL